jgi:hypothetical protein
MQQQANTPAISPETLRNMQGNILRHAGQSAAMTQRDLRENLARRGLGSGARGVEYARRSRAEAGPSTAAAFTNAAIQAALSNAQARRQSMSGLAGLYGMDPYRRDFTSEMQMFSERDLAERGRAREGQDWEAITSSPFWRALMAGAMQPASTGWGVAPPVGAR